jgi:dynactin 4
MRHGGDCLFLLVSSLKFYPDSVVKMVDFKYCSPACLFEVPSASVKSEKNRCARNCFECPLCSTVLSVVASAQSTLPPPTLPSSASSSTTSLMDDQAEPSFAPQTSKYHLYCGVCRWTSLEVGIQFDKPTGLACT